jgi:uncharacterized protein YhjY with autotransporter beta-barrel domain
MRRIQWSQTVKLAISLSFLIVLVASVFSQNVLAADAVLGVLQVQAAPGEVIEQDFFVPAPYPVTATTDLGLVSPTVFTQPGFVDYLYQVPAGLAPGARQTATIFLTDATGSVGRYIIEIEVVAQGAGGGVVVGGALNLAGAPGETVNYAISILPEDNLPITLSATFGTWSPSSFVSVPQPTFSVYSYTIPANAVPGTPLVGSFTFTETIGGQPVSTSLALNVAVLGEVPTNILANDDIATVTSEGGGVAVANILANDTLNGQPATSDTVAITSFGDLPNGFRRDQNATVEVLAGTPAGVYSISYQICARAAPTACDTAEVVITVTSSPLPIVATDDFGTVSQSTGGVAVANVLSNDTLLGQPATLAGVSLLALPGGSTVPQLDIQTGAVSVPQGAQPGTYVLLYRICELPEGACADAQVTVTVTAPAIVTDGDFTAAVAAGASATILFSVTADAYPVSIAAELGTVTPSTLPGPGQVTYSLLVPENAEIGALLEDTIAITDASGFSRTVAVQIDVVGPEQQNVSEVPNLTPNQQELAVVVDDRCEGTTNEDFLLLCERLRNPDNTDAQIAEALEAINPEETLAASVIAVRVASVQRNNVSQRISSLRSGTAKPGVDVSGLTVRSGDSVITGDALAEMLHAITGGAAGDDFGRWGYFVDGNINSGEKSDTLSDAGFDFDGVGVTGGFDYRLNDNLVLGAALGYSLNDVDFRGAGGKLEVEAWDLVLFGSWFSERYYADAQVSYGRTDYDSLRRVRFEDASGLFDRTARGNTDGAQLSGAIAAGYDFNFGAWTLGPHVGANLLDAEVDALREQGAGSLSMQVGEQEARSLTASAGGHVTYAYNASWGVLLPHLRFDWTREFETDVDRVLVNFADDAQSTYLLRGDRIDPSYFLWSAGVSAQFIHGISGFVNFQQMLGFQNLAFSQINYGLRYERAF